MGKDRKRRLGGSGRPASVRVGARDARLVVGDIDREKDGLGGGDSTKVLGHWNSRSADIRLAIRALNSGWPVGEETKRLIIENAGTFLDCALRDGDRRTFTALSRLYLEFDKQNIERMKLALAAERQRLESEVRGALKDVDADVVSEEASFAEYADELRARRADRDASRSDGDRSPVGSEGCGASGSVESGEEDL